MFSNFIQLIFYNIMFIHIMKNKKKQIVNEMGRNKIENNKFYNKYI